MVLEQIVRHKRELLSERSSTIHGYRPQLLPSKKSFLASLQKKRTAFICEIKPASPSQGILRKNIDIQEVAAIYAPFADAISVLADEKFFHGSLANVKKISDEQRCPILCKDIVIGPEQIYEARHHGADVVLLMLSVLDDKTYAQCRDAAALLAMDVISEVHNEEETARALKLGASIIGINNRNLKTLEIDMSTTERLLPLIPKKIPVISESGFSSHEQIMRYASRVSGFLVGSSLMRAQRIDRALRELIFGRVKICGITNAEDARCAYEAGAYYGGLNFSASSKRVVTLQEARDIKKGAPLSWGGVFVDQPLDEVISVANELKFDFVQLHGHEEKDYINDLRPLLPIDCEIWQAIRVKNTIEIPVRVNADLILFDSFHESAMGGTGTSFNWDLLRKKIAQRFGIAGGINVANAHQAAQLNPWLIDIASGAENNDCRRKSPERLKEIFNALRG